MDDGSLVLRLVWEVAIRPRYANSKRRYADQLHGLISSTHMSTREPCLKGLMDVVEYVSNRILIEYGYATPWYVCDRLDVYYP